MEPHFCLYEAIRQAEQFIEKKRAIIAPIRMGTERHDFSLGVRESQATAPGAGAAASRMNAINHSNEF